MSTQASLIKQNFFVLSVGQLMSRFLAFAITVQLTRVLSPDQYGATVFATTILLYVSIMVDLGFDTLGPIEIARNTTPSQQIVKTILTMRCLSVLPALLSMVFLAWLLPVPALTKTIILLYGLILIPTALDISWCFLGSRIMLPAMVAEVLSQLLLAVGVFLIVKMPGDVIYVPLVLLGSKIISVTYLFVCFIRRFGAIKFDLDFTLAKALIPRALPLMGSAVVGRIIENFDILLVGLWIGAEATGLYGASYRFVWMLILLAVSFYTALRPSLAQAYVHGFHTIAAMMSRTMRISTALAIGAAVGGIMVAPALIDLLYGKAYMGAVQPFQILLVFFALHMVSRTYRVLLISFNRQANDFKIMSAAAILNIILNIILIKRYGIVGGACANVGSEMLILCLNYASTRRFIANVSLGRHILRPALAAAVMAAMLKSTPHLHVLVQIALGGTVYIIMLWLLRAITKDDIRAIFKRSSSVHAVGEPVPTAANQPNDSLLACSGLASKKQ